MSDDSKGIQHGTSQETVLKPTPLTSDACRGDLEPEGCGAALQGCNAAQPLLFIVSM